ncbi:hypothetical protein M2326_003051, partial [Flavobacterium sp. 7A]|nr:hypothetical protein [Flavobacterium sp. 7A]
WGFYYIMTKKTIKRAAADVGLIFTAYNLRRIFNLVDQNLLKKYLKVLTLFILAVTSFFKACYEYNFYYPKLNIYSKNYLTVA